MNEHTNTETTDNLLAALENLSSISYQSPIITYRVYYDEITKICMFKSIEEPPPVGSFIIVSAETYDKMAFCPQWYINNDKIPTLIPVDSSPTIMLKLDNTSPIGWTTYKDNLVFRSNEPRENLDNWILRTHNDE